MILDSATVEKDMYQGMLHLCWPHSSSLRWNRKKL